jgi:hypothetical protein
VRSFADGAAGCRAASFQRVGDADYYDANDFAGFALQPLLAMLVVCVALGIGALLWRRSHKPG